MGKFFSSTIPMFGHILISDTEMVVLRLCCSLLKQYILCFRPFMCARRLLSISC